MNWKSANESESFDSSDLTIAQPAISDYLTQTITRSGISDNLFVGLAQPTISGDLNLKLPTISGDLMQALLYHLMPSTI